MGEAGNDYLSVYNSTGANLLDGGDGDDNLIGGTGDDTLKGGVGSDLMQGGSGNDVYYIDDLNDEVWEAGGEDTAYVSVNGYKASNEIEHVIYTSGAESLPYFIDTLLSGSHWGKIAQAQTLTYSFVTQATDGLTGFATYSSEQQSCVRLVLSKYSAVSGVEFTEVTDGSDVALRYFRDDLNSAGYGGYAGYAEYPSGGDVHIMTDYADMSLGGYGFQLLEHETGHALGLKHPFEAPVLDPAEDYQANTVMTYNNTWPCAQDIGLFDLATIQYLYGVNHGARTGNDTYRISDRYIWDGAGNDTLSATDQTSAVSINLHAGSWIYVGSKASSLLASGQAFVGFGTELENASGGSGNDTIAGNEISNFLTGGNGNDNLSGYAGNDSLDGGAGVDGMLGGKGNDIYYVDLSTDVITENLNEGTDTVYSTASSFTLSANLENGRVYTSNAVNLTGNSLNNVLYAGAGSNGLVGGDGTDTLSYVYGVTGTTGVTVSLASITAQTTGGSGSDTISGFENLTGSNNNDSLTGSTGNNALNGGLGTDTLVGGAGDDTYYVDVAGDVVTESSTAGKDLVLSSFLGTYVMGNYVEDGRINSIGAANLTGNSLSNILYAGAGNNILNGGAGTEADTASYQYSLVSGATHGVTVSLLLTGAQNTSSSGSDTLTNIENLTGSSLNDTLIGSAGNNVLDGGSGTDSLVGGLGNDTYVINTSADIIVENAKEGTDTVNVLFSGYTLTANFENGRISTTAAANLTGNTLNNVLYAGAGNNNLAGGDGTDTLSYTYGVTGTTGVTVSLASTTAQATGGSGSDTISGFENLTGSNYNDTLTGNAGNNALNGGLGADSMTGGDGNDTYYVDNTGDAVIETNAASTSGSDTVYSYLTHSSTQSYTLGANVENGRIVTTAASNLTGNTLSNTLYAGAGNNILNGSTGTDTVSYQYGLISSATAGVNVSLALTSAQTTGNSGSDTLLNVENLTGSSLNDTLTGSTAANTLTGGAGSDRFVFSTAFSASNIDTITDFASGTDKIVLDDDIFTALGVTGTTAGAALKAGSFYAAAGITAVHASTDRILYDTGSGKLYYDADGLSSTASVQIALIGVSTHPALAVTDFLVAA